MAERTSDALWPAVVGVAPTVPDGSPWIDLVGSEATPWLRWNPAAAESYRTAIDALDELTLAPTAQLDDHLRHVGQLARRIAESIGLPPELCDVVDSAGRFHDLGKADPRFQRWLGAPSGQLMAKSASTPGRWQQLRVAAGWPAGARHELLSVQLLDAALAQGLNLDDNELIRHLVISHHGHGRPSVDTSPEPAPLEQHYEHLHEHPVSATLDPGRADFEQPGRYRSLCEHYGLWGLALLETVVRQADHIISAVTEVQ